MTHSQECSLLRVDPVHTVTSRQPLAALEPTKPLTRSFYCAQLWLRETKTVWVVQRHKRAKAERRGTGRGENSVCCAASDSVCGVASDSVCFVWTSDTVIEQRRKGVVHLGRDTEFERHQGQTGRSDQIRTDLFARN